MSDQVRVRFAPSPTGSMHVGNVRTAIYNWLYARSQGGKFLLRIEDTDPARSRQEWVDVILDGLRWLELDWDDEPVFQSQRMPVYRDMAERLLAQGSAYRCTCDPAELQAEREAAQRSGTGYLYDGRCRRWSSDEVAAKQGQPFTVRLKSDCEVIRYQDGVHGVIQVSGDELDDLVLLRRDGTPTYHFAVVVDDHEMGITHVLRGDDHISNTPKQLQIYQGFKWNPPQFSHLPLILGSDKKPLSKRHGAMSLEELREAGVLSHALLNYLALLGWYPGEDREIMSREELIRAFGIEGMSSHSAVFDPAKLEWLNGEHISQMAAMDIYHALEPFLNKASVREAVSHDQWLGAIDLLKSRARYLTDFLTRGEYLFRDPEHYEPKGVAKHWKPETGDRLQALATALTPMEGFEEAAIEDVVRSLAEELDVSAAKLIHPTRLALTGGTVSPGIFELMAFLGKDTVVRRLQRAVELVGQSQDNTGQDS